MPPKVEELIESLKQAGFEDRGGKGSRRIFVHPNVTLSGKLGEDAKKYQIRAVEEAAEEAQK